jgi:hypothetical protein
MATYLIENVNEEGEVYDTRSATQGFKDVSLDLITAFQEALTLLDEFPNDSIRITYQEH